MKEKKKILLHAQKLKCDFVIMEQYSTPERVHALFLETHKEKNSKKSYKREKYLTAEETKHSFYVWRILQGNEFVYYKLSFVRIIAIKKAQGKNIWK